MIVALAIAVVVIIALALRVRGLRRLANSYSHLLADRDRLLMSQWRQLSRLMGQR